MPILSMTCAFGNSPEVTLPSASTVNLAPADDSVDSNRVHLTGTATINSFGVAYGCDPQPDIEDEDGNTIEMPPLRPFWSVTKYVRFDKNIVLHHNPPTLSLLGKADRTTRKDDIGTYTSDGAGLGHWTEEGYTTPVVSPVNPVQFKRNVICYTVSQTITIPTFGQTATITMVGGGGFALGNFTAAGAAGAGAYLEKTLTNLIGGNTLVLTVGAGGTLGSQNGGNTILASGTQTITTLTAGGGAHGNNVAGSSGVATGGDLNIPGGTTYKIDSDAYTNALAEMYTGGNPWSSPLLVKGLGFARAGQGYGGGAVAAGNPSFVFTDYSANGTPGLCKIDWFGMEPLPPEE